MRLLAAVSLCTALLVAACVATGPTNTTITPKWLATTTSQPPANFDVSFGIAAVGDFIGGTLIQSNGDLVAIGINPVNGSTKFTFTLPPTVNTTGVQWQTCPQNTAVAFLVVLGSSLTDINGLIMGVDATTGKRLWTLPQEIDSFSNTIITCSMNGATAVILTPAAVTAVDAATGKLAWVGMINGTAVSPVWFTVASKDGAHEYFLYQDNNGIHRIDMVTGATKVLFVNAFVPDGDLQSPLAVTKNLIIMNGGFNVTAFDVDGTAVWTLPELGQVVYGDIILTKTSVPTLGAYNATTGKPLWWWQNLSTEVSGASILNLVAGTPEGSAFVATTPVSANGAVTAVGVTGRAGAVAWTNMVPVGAAVPLVTSGYVVFPNAAGQGTMWAWAVNIRTGEARTLTGLGNIISALETDGLLLLQGSAHTAAYAAW